MLYIQKKEEPASLTKYRKQPFAYFDGYPDKDDIRNQLLTEQGHLCAYCMRRINKAHMKIEHWYPEQKLSDLECLDYENMLGVCEGHIMGSKGEDDTCDTHKGKDEITIDPRNKNMIDKIQYRTATGEIYSEDDQIQNDLNHTLNLNSEKHRLKENRKDTLNAMIAQLSNKQERGTWNKKLLEKTISLYEQPDAMDKKKEYAGIVLWYLKKKLNA